MRNLYAIHDHKTDAFGPIFSTQTEAEAIRMFSDIANDKNDTVGKHPEDFTLHYVGDYNEQTGKINGEQAGNAIARAIDLQRKD